MASSQVEVNWIIWNTSLATNGQFLIHRRKL